MEEVTGKPIPPPNYTQGGLVCDIIANPYPGYSFAMVYMCQTKPWLQFGYNLHVPKYTPGNFRYSVWFGCYTGSSSLHKYKWQKTGDK